MLTYLLVIIRYLSNLFFRGGRTEYTTSLDDDDVDQVTKAEAEEEAELTIFYKCHICAIDVPAAFARDHAASVKHRANARIASVAALRMRAIISAQPPPIAPHSAQRFCANCARIVSENHERTKEHHAAVMHDKKLLDLMTVYVGDDDDDDDDDSKSYDNLDLGFNDTEENIVNKDCNKSNGTKNIISDSDEEDMAIKRGEKNKEAITAVHQNHNTIGKITNGDHRHIETNTKKCEAKHEVIDKVKDTKTKDVEVTATVSVNNESSDKNKGATDRVTKKTQFIAKTTPKATTTISNKDYVQLFTKDNKVVKVLNDNYHSFIRKEDTINCLVCSSVFFIKEEVSHKFSVKHYLNKKPNAIDEHCVRKINDIYSHCILCNELVQNSQVTEHHQITSHMEREKPAIIGNPHISKAIVTNKQHSNITVAETLPITPDIKVSDTKNESKSTNNKHVTKHYQVTCQDERRKLISKPTVTITQELDLAVTPVGNDLKRQESKVNDAKNKKKSSKDEPDIYSYELTDQENIVRCIICDCKVPNHPTNKEEHLSGQYHSVNVSRRQSKKTNSDVKNMKTEHTERKDKKCEEKDNKKDHRVNDTKNVKVQKNITGNNECSNNNYHKTETDEKNDETIAINITPSTSTITTGKNKYFEFITRNHKLVNVLNDNYHSFIRKGDTVNCLVCCSVFSNKEEAAHMLSLEHFLNKMPNAIDENCVRKINDIHSHCILCNKLVKNKNVTKHYQTTGHREKEKYAITDHKNKTETTVDKTPVNLDVSTTPAVDAVIKNPELKDTDTQNEAKLNKNVPVIIDPYESMMQGFVRCTICDCKVTNNEKNKKEHIEGYNHAINARKCESITSNSQVKNTETKLMDKQEEIHKESANVNEMGSVSDTRNQHFLHQNHVTNQNEMINSESTEMKQLYGKDKKGGAVDKIDNEVNDSETNTGKTEMIESENIKNNNKTHNEATLAKTDVSKAPDVDAEVEIKMNSPNEAKPSIDWPVIHPYEKSGSDYIRCTICDCQVLNNPEIRKEHLVGSTHTNNVKNKYINLRI